MSSARTPLDVERPPARSVPLLLYVAFQLLYGAFVFRHLPLVGDAADYASLIAHGAFDARTTHIGFLLVYRPLYGLNEALLGIDPTLFSNLLTTLFGALSVVVAYLLLSEVLSGSGARRRRVALHGAVIYGLCGLVWYNAEFAEVQSLMLLLLDTSLFLFVRRHHVVAGLVFAAAALVSQACLAAAPWFVALAIRRRTAHRELARFGLAWAVLLGGVIAVLFDDYFWGPRGLVASHTWWPRIPLWKALLAFHYSVLESFWLLAPLAVPSIWRIRRESELLWLSIASLPGFLHLGARLSQVEYGFIWMPVFLLVAAWLAVGLEAAVSRAGARVAAVIAPVLGTLFLVANLVTHILPKRAAATRADACLEAIAAEVAGGMVVAKAHVGFAYAHKNWPELPDVLDAPWTMALPASTRDYQELVQRREVFLLDYRPPSHFLRAALLDNPVSRRFIPEDIRRQYLEEFELFADRLRMVVGPEAIEPVTSCGEAQLWRLRPVPVRD